jgi:hypothetical protein
VALPDPGDQPVDAALVDAVVVIRVGMERLLYGFDIKAVDGATELQDPVLDLLAPRPARG